VHTELRHANFSSIVADFDREILHLWKEPILNKRSWIGSKQKAPNESGTRFAKRHGVKIDTVIQWIVSGQLNGNLIQLPTGRRLVSLKSGQVPPQSSKLTQGKTLAAAAQQLGTSKNCLRKLAEKGYLRGTKDVRTGVWSVDTTSLIHTLFDSQHVSMQDIGESKVDIITAAKYYLPRGCDLVTLISALATGNLPYACNTSEHHFSKVYVSIENLKKWVIGDQYMSIPDFCATRGINQEYGYQLTKLGFLPTTSFGRMGKMISTNASVTFDRIYMLAREARIVLRLNSTKAVIEALRDIAVLPVSGPTIDGARQYLFLREDIYAKPQ
jgi:hypothetical protein